MQHGHHILVITLFQQKKIQIIMLGFVMLFGSVFEIFQELQQFQEARVRVSFSSFCTFLHTYVTLYVFMYEINKL